MATNSSEHLGLHLWEPTDQVLRTEFNQNWTKLDTAVNTAQQTAEAAWSASNPPWEMGSANISESAVDTVIHTFGFMPSVVIAWAASYHLGATDGSTTATLNGTTTNGGRCYLNLSGAQLKLTHFYNGPYKVYFLALR